MNGGQAGAPPRAPLDHGPGHPSLDGARAPAGKPAPGKPAGKADPGTRDAPGADFTAALVVAAVHAPPPLPPLPGAELATDAGTLAPAPRQKSDAPPPVRNREPIELKLPAETGTARDAAGPRAPAPPAEPREAPAAPASSGPALPAPPPALAGAVLSGALLPRAAHLSLDTGGAGDIGLHLRVRDGVTDVRIDGDVAELVEPRSAELRLALAREGLQLGTLELSGGTGGDPARHGASGPPEAPEAGPPRADEPRPTAGESGPRQGAPDRRGGTIHVEA